MKYNMHFSFDLILWHQVTALGLHNQLHDNLVAVQPLVDISGRRRESIWLSSKHQNG